MPSISPAAFWTVALSNEALQATAKTRPRHSSAEPSGLESRYVVS